MEVRGAGVEGSWTRGGWRAVEENGTGCERTRAEWSWNEGELDERINGWEWRRVGKEQEGRGAGWELKGS